MRTIWTAVIVIIILALTTGATSGILLAQDSAAAAEYGTGWIIATLLTAVASLVGAVVYLALKLIAHGPKAVEAIALATRAQEDSNRYVEASAGELSNLRSEISTFRTALVAARILNP